jgi:hypothetical protein
MKKLKMKKALSKNANPFSQPLGFPQPPLSGEFSDRLAERHKAETELIYEICVQLDKILDHYRGGRGETCADLFAYLNGMRLRAEEAWELIEDLELFGE